MKPTLAPWPGFFSVFKVFFEKIPKVVLGFRNFGYDFEGLGEMFEDDISAIVDGGPSGGSCVR